MQASQRELDGNLAAVGQRQGDVLNMLKVCVDADAVCVGACHVRNAATWWSRTQELEDYIEKLDFSAAAVVDAQRSELYDTAEQVCNQLKHSESELRSLITRVNHTFDERKDDPVRVAARRHAAQLAPSPGVVMFWWWCGVVWWCARCSWKRCVRSCMRTARR